MKNLKNFILFGLSFSLMIFISGCEKDKPVEPVAPQPFIEAFATPSKGPAGDSILITLNWDIKYAIAGYLDGILLEVFKDSKELYIDKNTTFVFKARNEDGIEVTELVFAKGPVFEAPTIELSADPDTLPVGGGITTISWTTQRVDSVKYNGVWYAPNGSIETGFIASTSDFTVIVKGKEGEDTFTLTVKVLTQEDIISECLNSGLWSLTQKEFCDTLGVSYAIYWTIENNPLCEAGYTSLLFTRNPNKYFVDYGYDCNGVYQGTSAYLNVNWSVNGMIILFHTDNPVYNDTECQIDSITKDLFAYSVPSWSVGGEVNVPILIRYTLKHL